GDGLADFPDRLDLGHRETQTLELLGARLQHRFMTEGHECGEQALADGRRAGRRKLLPAHNGAETGEARLAPAQGKSAGLLGDGLEPWIAEDELLEPGVQVVLRVEEGGHAT